MAKTIDFTDKALQQIKMMRDKMEVPDDHHLRVGVSTAGHVVLTYILGFDIRRDDDLEYEGPGFKILIDQRHSLYVIGMKIDYAEGKGEPGFVFHNPTKLNPDS